MATTYKLFADKMGGSDPATYIGNVGEVFYNPATGALRVSDGTTPGGTAITSGGGAYVVENQIQGTVTGSLIPDTNVAYDLGSAELKFRDLYLDSATIHTTEGNISTVGGELTFDGEPVIMLSDLQEIAAASTDFADFKNRIASL